MISNMVTIVNFFGMQTEYHEPETPYTRLKNDSNARNQAIKRLKQKGHKQPNVDQIMAEMQKSR